MMTSLKGLIYLATLALLAIVFHAAMGSDANGDSAMCQHLRSASKPTATIPRLFRTLTVTGQWDLAIF